MGYELHIARKNNWDDYEEESNITLAEWLDYVKTDAELELTEGYWVKVPGENFSQPKPGFCEWTAHSTEKRPGYRPWLDYRYGSISAKYPDAETIRKMIAIAEALDARVVGDDGEFYDEEAVVNMEAADAARTASPPPPKPWWKFW